MSELHDKAGAQRVSEKLAQQELETYLLAKGVISSSIIKIEQFAGGASNLTYRVVTTDEDLVLRRPPFGKKAKSAHDMQREMTVLSALSPVLSSCPKPRHYCDDENIIGSTFYVMDRINGAVIRREMPDAVPATKELCSALCKELVDHLVQLHQINPSEVGLQKFGKPEGYVQRQVEGWISRLEAVVTSNTLDFSSLTQWLVDQMPNDSKHSAIIHNDYKFDNVMWDAEKLLKGDAQLIGILDWEMATLGDPLMDLGSVLAYWVNADDSPMMQHVRMMPTHLPGMLTREEVGQYYLKQRGWPAMNLNYYHVFGLFRLAVIVQQIYYRYDLGQSDNPKFAPFGDMANLLIQAAQELTSPK